MSVSDRIALMQAGKLGTGRRAGRDLSSAGNALRRRVHGHRQRLPGAGARPCRAGLGVAQPEALRFAEEAPAGWPRLAGRVSRVEMLGPLSRIDVVLQNGTVLKMATLDQPHHALAVTARVALAYDPARLMILP